MKTRKKVYVILTVMAIVLAFSTSAFAAKKQKLIKTIKEYEDGKLVYSQDRTYDSKGGLTKIKWTTDYGEKASGTSIRKITYWGKNSKVIKKVVIKDGNSTATYTYTKKGLVRKEVYSSKDYKQTTTYKNNGKRLTSYVTKDSSGKKTSEGTYDKHGNLLKFTDYNEDRKSVYKYNNTYRNGILTKRVLTDSEGRVYTSKYDKKGNLISYVAKDSGGKVTYKETYENTYKSGYLTKTTSERISEGGTKTKVKTVYTYTKKSY